MDSFVSPNLRCSEPNPRSLQILGPPDATDQNWMRPVVQGIQCRVLRASSMAAMGFVQCINLRTAISPLIYTCIYLYTYVCNHGCNYVCIKQYIYIYTYVCTYMYIHVYIYTYNETNRIKQIHLVESLHMYVDTGVQLTVNSMNISHSGPRTRHHPRGHASVASVLSLENTELTQSFSMVDGHIYYVNIFLKKSYG